MNRWKTIPLALVFLACSRTPEADRAGRLCAAYLTCVDGGGMTPCVNVLHTVEGIADDWGRHTAYFFFPPGRNVLGLLALYQNGTCVEQAGANCERVLACLSAGQVSCTPDAGQPSGCADGGKLITCATGRNPDTETVALSLRCAEFGQGCYQLPSDLGAWPVCGQPASDYSSTVEVTCDGALAHVHIGDVEVQDDCSAFDGTCRAGTWPDWGSVWASGVLPDYCVGALEATCEENPGVFLRCQGANAIWCFNGREALRTCSPSGGGPCTPESPWGCDYPSCQERCTDGVIEYCDAYRKVKLDCRDVGFSGCSDTDYGARCMR